MHKNVARDVRLNGNTSSARAIPMDVLVRKTFPAFLQVDTVVFRSRVPHWCVNNVCSFYLRI